MLFTNKLNGIAADIIPAATAPAEQTAATTDVPRLRAAVPAFEQRGPSPVTLPAGSSVRIVFRRNSDPGPGDRPHVPGRGRGV